MTSGTYFQFLFALAVVLALLAGLSWAVRRFGFTGGGFTLQPGKKRIAIVEMTAIDPKRRLVLVRPDGHVAWRGHDAPDEPLDIIDTVRGAA